MIQVERAAIVYKKRHNGEIEVVVRGDKNERHIDIISENKEKIDDLRLCFEEEQGFIISDGSFVSRSEAYEVAKKAGQIVSSMDTGELTTNDLW